MKPPRTIKYRGHLYWKQEGARTVRESDVEDVDSIIHEEKEWHGKIAELKTALVNCLVPLEAINSGGFYSIGDTLKNEIEHAIRAGRKAIEGEE